MSLQDRLKNAQANSFVGREQQLSVFRKNLTAEIPVFPFILISGPGGVGKSTLLEQFQLMCSEGHIPCALTDAESSPPAVMDQLVTSFERKGFLLKTFRDRYQEYLQFKEVIQKAPDKPDALVPIFSRLAGKGIVLVGRATPFTSAALDLVGTEIVEQQVIAFSNWLFEKLRQKDDVQLMLDPISQLTPLFVTDLNKLSRQKQAVLFFDTFEETSVELLPWLLSIFDGQYGEVSDHVSFVFAGRSFNQQDWLPVSSLLIKCEIEPFTKQETSSYLERQKIVNPLDVENIFLLSEGLPVHVAMLATNSGTLDIRTANTVVDGFLRQIEDPLRRRSVLQMALCRQFNRDTLAHLSASESDDAEIEKTFAWLITLPFVKFVQSTSGHWTYHPITRAQFIAYQRGRSLGQFVAAHEQLAKFYHARAEQHGRFAEFKWQDHAWWTYYVEATYHELCANPRQHLAKTKQEIADMILEVDKTAIVAWISALRQASTDAGDYEPAIQLAALVEAGISAIETNKMNEAFKLFDVFDILKSQPQNLGFEEGTNVQRIPVGWIATGENFKAGVDTNVSHTGQHSAYVKSDRAQLYETGELVQIIKAENYLEKRIRFSGYLKSKDVEEWATFWVRVDGRMAYWLKFDDMRDRPITGTTDWQKYELVLDVPRESSRIVFGFRLHGKGQIWADDLAIEVVGPDIPTTDASSRNEPQNLDFSHGTIGTDHFPIGWNNSLRHRDQYAIGVDRSELHHGNTVAFLRSRVTKTQKEGWLAQGIQANHYLGKRICMSAYIRTRDVEDWSGLWMNIHRKEQGSLIFDNMRNRPISGTTDWQKYSVVLDVPQEAIGIDFGVLLQGSGQIWISDFRFETVGDETPVTKRSNSDPVNLDFEEGFAGKYPKGWFLYVDGATQDHYTVDIDGSEHYLDKASATIKSNVDQISGFGTLMQTFYAEKYLDQRLLLSVYLKTANVMERVWAWMRVDSAVKASLTFDNMDDRPISGTTDWQKYEIVLDVPEQSRNISFGFSLHGTGQVWANRFKFDVVGPEVAITGRDNPEQLISNYSKSIESNPQDPTPFYRRAIAYIGAKDFEKALLDCNEALRLNPSYAEALGSRGYIYMAQGNYELSIRDLKHSISLDPSDSSTFYDLASAYALQKNVIDTVINLRRCLEMDKNQFWFRKISEDVNFDFVRDDPRFHAVLIEFSRPT